jgi:hypothetical protein
MTGFSSNKLSSTMQIHKSSANECYDRFARYVIFRTEPCEVHCGMSARPEHAIIFPCDAPSNSLPPIPTPWGSKVDALKVDRYRYSRWDNFLAAMDIQFVHAHRKATITSKGRRDDVFGAPSNAEDDRTSEIRKSLRTRDSTGFSNTGPRKRVGTTNGRLRSKAPRARGSSLGLSVKAIG